ncbi:MAG: 4-oxalocrotonate decarboxylase [bacterium]|nr:4-oxalocrotonate decarboxylase [bacterium]
MTKKVNLYILIIISLLVVPELRGDETQWIDQLTGPFISKQCLPVLSPGYPGANENTAYRVQKALVEKALAKNKPPKPAGFKAGLTSKGAQKRFGVDKPVTGVLITPGITTAKPLIKTTKGLMLETEIGFIIAKPITGPITNAAELRGYISAVLPVIEMPVLCFNEPGKMTGLDIIAGNVAAAKYIKGAEKNLKTAHINDVSVTLHCDGKEINSGKGSEAMGDQWKAVLWLINTVVSQGWSLEPGQLIITGALGKMIPAKPGNYTANYGIFGKIHFTIEKQ